MSMTSRRNTTTTTTRYDAAAGTVRACRRGTRTLLWAGRPLLAVCFVSASVQKVAGTGYMVHLFGKIGAGQWLRYLIGVLEFAGAGGVLAPKLEAAGLTQRFALVPPVPKVQEATTNTTSATFKILVA